MIDVAIIGAGVVGGMVARELTKYSLNVCILENAPTLQWVLPVQTAR